MRETTDRQADTGRKDLEMEAPEQESEAESDTKFEGGKPPAGGFNGGTSNLAYEEDSNERELKLKIGKLVTEKFDGDYKKAFEHYDTSRGGSVGKSELVKLLSDAGVGNGLTRGAWASGIIDKLDANQDKAIDWSEFESVFKATA